MEWVERRYQQYVDERRDWGNVCQHAEEIYEGLWEEIVKVANDPTIAFTKIVTNGLPQHRTVALGKRILKIDLAEDKHSIIASPPDSPEILLAVTVCPDGVVCLKHDGERVTYSQAAQKIMEPFIFGGESPYAGRRSSAHLAGQA